MNDKRPIVSICMITYNHEKYIAQAIDSVLMQKTKFDYEIIIGEDCSTDKTREIVLEYKAKYSDKIKLLLQDKNVGMMQNFIDTLKACTGKYIALLEGDDYWTDPFKLQKQVDFLEAHAEYSMCFTARNVVDSYNNFLREERYPKKIYTIKDVVEGFIPPTQTFLLRNFDNISNFLNAHITHPSGDRLVTYYCSLLGDIYYLDEVSSCYHDSGEGVWSSFDYWQKREKRLERFREFYKILGIEENNINLIDRGLYEFYSRIKAELSHPLKLIKNFTKYYRKYLDDTQLSILLAVLYLRIKRRVVKFFGKTFFKDNL